MIKFYTSSLTGSNQPSERWSSPITVNTGIQHETSRLSLVAAVSVM